MTNIQQKTPTSAEFSQFLALNAELSTLVKTASILKSEGYTPHQFTLADALTEPIFNLRIQLASNPVHIWCAGALEETQTTENKN